MSAMNVVSNALQPIDVRNTKSFFAGAETILAEALMSYLARWTFGTEKRPFFELVAIHALANPLLGASESIISADVKGYDDAYTDQLMKGLAQLPAVYTSQYIYGTFSKGFRVPSFVMKDILITAGSKIATRPFLKFIYENGPKANQDVLANGDKLVARQRTVRMGVDE